jgi:hypothetical protein
MGLIAAQQFSAIQFPRLERFDAALQKSTLAKNSEFDEKSLSEFRNFGHI